MKNDFRNIADEFFVNLNLQTTLSLPDSRETILHFCEAVQKEFPSMTSFYRRETGEYVLEGNHDSGSYQWMELQSHHLSAGYFNPPTVEDAVRMHRWLLDRSTYYLGITGLDVECLDLLLGFNFDFLGNRDAIVAQAIYGGTPLWTLATDGSAKPIECEPCLVIGLEEDCYLQAKVSLETRSNSYQVRTGQYEDEPISIYFTVRQYPQPDRKFDHRESFENQVEKCTDLVGRIVVPQIIGPIAAAIASAQ